MHGRPLFLLDWYAFHYHFNWFISKGSIFVVVILFCIRWCIFSHYSIFICICFILISLTFHCNYTVGQSTLVYSANWKERHMILYVFLNQQNWQKLFHHFISLSQQFCRMKFDHLHSFFIFLHFFLNENIWLKNMTNENVKHLQKLYFVLLKIIK